MIIKPGIELTADGSPTLKHSVSGEYYHSLNGARAESEHVFIAAGFDFFAGKSVRVLEVGFGSGLNAWLTMLRCAETGRSVDYSAIELYPVAQEVVRELSYATDARFMDLHTSKWNNGFARITPYFRLKKMETNLLTVELDGVFDIVYFDAFAPDIQPELWSVDVFSKIFASLSPGGVLVTYSAKGDVKRALRKVGFEVSRLEGAMGKRHMIRAVRP